MMNIRPPPLLSTESQLQTGNEAQSKNNNNKNKSVLVLQYSEQHSTADKKKTSFK